MPDPSIFSTEGDPVGIQVGTAITTLVRKGDHKPANEIGFRHLWGQAKPEELTATAEEKPDTLYTAVKPVLPLGLPFVQTAVGDGWFNWPTLPELLPVSFPGVKTSRDGLFVDVDLDRLRTRVADYSDKALSHEEIARRYPAIMKSTQRFDAHEARNALLERAEPADAEFIRFTYRPFDNRWLYWEKEGLRLDRPRPDYMPHVFEGNLWLSAAKHLRKGEEEPQACLTRNMACLHLIERTALMFPVWLRSNGIGGDSNSTSRANLSGAARRYVERLGVSVEDLFHHILATLHDPAYRKTNAAGLRMGWPRIPLPGWPDGEGEGAAAALAEVAARGRELAALLDPETPVPGVTQVPLRSGTATIAVPATVETRNMARDDFAVTAGWGHYGNGDAVMPGSGRTVERPYTPEERVAIGPEFSALGETTFDIYLNGNAYWRNIPAAVWHYKLGGYQVLKKWLSYRDRDVLGRVLSPKEVQDFTDIARRIGRILMITSTLGRS